MLTAVKRRSSLSSHEYKWGKRSKLTEISRSKSEKKTKNDRSTRKSGSRSIYFAFFDSGICKLCGREVKSLTASMAQRHLRRNHASALADAPQNPMAEFDWTAFLRTVRNDETIASDLEEQSDCLPPSSSPSLSPDLPSDSLFMALRSLGGQLDDAVGDPRTRQIMGGIDANNKDIKSNRCLTVDLMNQFYRLGWVFGTGGAMCFRNDPEGLIFVTPSSIPKDLLTEDDIGVVTADGEIALAPACPNTISSCFQLFATIFRTHETYHTRNFLNSVIHTHSVESNLIASFPSEPPYSAIRLANEEMLKGIINRSTGIPYTNTEECLIPVIENAPSEGAPEFSERIREAMLSYPDSSAILVRNHGAFYFGRDWKETKIMAEIFEYLFKLTLHKLKHAPHLKSSVFVQ